MTATAKPRATKPPAKKPSPTAAQAGAADSFDEVCSVRIELRYTEPLIWREVEVPTSMTLKLLHDVIQIAMGWRDHHLWEFTIGRQSYGILIDDDWAVPPRIAASKVRLRDVLKPRKTTINYLYDMGDSWEHQLVISNVRQGDPERSYPRYVAGEWAGPPEDCGGISGFYEALAARADPTHPEHAGITEWLGEYDPKEIKELPIKTALGRIANPRSAPQKRLPKTGG